MRWENVMGDNLIEATQRVRGRMAKQTITIPAGRASREFLIEYDADDAAHDVVRIDGVHVSVELLTTMIVDPPCGRLFKFERDGDVVTVKEVTSVENME
jgi:hypothetical protein